MSTISRDEPAIHIIGAGLAGSVNRPIVAEIFTREAAGRRQVIEAGADVIVAGSAVFNQDDYAAAIQAIRRDGE